MPKPTHLDTLIVTLLKDLEEPHEQTAGREHQNLEVDRDGRARPSLAHGGRRQVCFCSEGRVCASLESRNPARSPHVESASRERSVAVIPHCHSLPYDDVLCWNIFRFAYANLAIDFSRVKGRRDLDHDIASR